MKAKRKIETSTFSLAISGTSGSKLANYIGV